MYYLVIVQNDTTQAVYSFNSYDDALSMYHSELAYRSEGRNKTLCVIINEFGNTMTTELWERNPSNEGA